MPAVTAYIAFGANLGDRLANLQSAVAMLAAAEGVALGAVSGLYETAPVGGPEDQDSYLNAVARIETTLGPIPLLDLVLGIETAHRRTRDVRWGPRTLDLDILFYGDRTISGPRLEAPHPRLQDRAFVLVPLCDVAADWVHPVLKRSVRDMCAALPAEDLAQIFVL